MPTKKLLKGVDEIASSLLILRALQREEKMHFSKN
jgi:hypothetical protein